MASEQRLWLILFLIPFIMLNPPALYWLNNYALAHPLTFGLPTLWLWTWVWLGVWFVEFGICASKSRIWKTVDGTASETGGEQR